MVEEQDEALGFRIKELRDKLGEDQATFAKRLGVSQSTVSRWEKGLQPPTAQAVEIMHRLAEAFEIALNEKTPHVRATGEIRAGGEVFFISPDFTGPRIIVPSSLPSIGLIVRSDVLPMCKDGDALIFLHPDPAMLEQCIGHLCLVHLPADHFFVKRVAKGSAPGRYALSFPKSETLDVADIISASRLYWISCKVDIE